MIRHAALLATCALGLAPAFAPAAARASSDLLIADFEGPTYGNWKIEGTAFGSAPARGTLPNQMPVTGYLGRGLANSFDGGDASTGRLLSPPFTIQRRYINFLIGGGRHPRQTCINLLVDGRVVRTETGFNDQPGGSEQLRPRAWDVSDLQGREASIEIVDTATGPWGHINVDQIMQSDTERTEKPASRDLLISRDYLHLPVKSGAPMRRLAYSVAGHTVREFDIELCADHPDFWVFSDVSAFKGQSLRISADSVPSDPNPLLSITQSDARVNDPTLYHEPLRPQFHFSTQRGWLNDPNGLVFENGTWHLYYQLTPYGWDSNDKHWGHATSPDLVHWTEQPIAIYPRAYGDWVWSGSAVMDPDNTSGFASGPNPVLVAAYTSTGRGECIVYSNDHGRTFTEYAGNPVVKHVGRDPRLLWYAPGKHWVMALYDEQGDPANPSHNIAFYSSPNLKDWHFESRIESFFECPELFEIPLEGTSEKRWVLYAANGDYLVGSFDGHAFTPDPHGKRHYNFGNCFYASQTYSNVPASDGRRIQIGWGTVSFPGAPFNQMMTFPVELTLHPTSDGPRLFAAPAREISSLYARTHTFRDVPLPAGATAVQGPAGDLYDITLDLAPGQASQAGLTIRGTAVLYDVARHELSCLDRHASLPLDHGTLHLRLLVDRTSLEIFAGPAGEVYMPMGRLFPADNHTLSLSAAGSGATVKSLQIHELNSIWK